MKKPKKITIKHYLNNSCKPTEKGYLVYILIIVNRKSTKIKSSIENRFFDTETMHKVAFKEIQNEKSEIEKIIKAKLLIDNNFTFKQPKRPIIVNKEKIVNQLENEILSLKRINKKQSERIKELEQYKLFKD